MKVEMQTEYVFDRDFTVGDVNEKVWSSFTEHLGRSIYGGIYDPGKPFSYEHGFRNDVKSVVRGLDLGVVRYPGGNFVSNYNWKDAIGPKQGRRKTMEFAWSGIETNQFGIEAFRRLVWVGWLYGDGADGSGRVVWSVRRSLWHPAHARVVGNRTYPRVNTPAT